MPSHGHLNLLTRTSDSTRSVCSVGSSTVISASADNRSSVTWMLSVIAHGSGGRRMGSVVVMMVPMVAVVVLNLVMRHIVVTGHGRRNVTTLTVFFTRRELWVDDVLRRPGVHQERTHGDHQFYLPLIDTNRDLTLCQYKFEIESSLN